MTDDRRAVIFGRNALAYELRRPGYPEDAIDHLVGLAPGGDLVEVGAGTGKATEHVARDGLRILCLEPSPQMAEVLAGKALGGVEVIVSTFEDWDALPDSTDLIYAAQAWHWVDRSTGYGKAMSALRPGGALALMWNILLDRFGRFEDAYRAHAPELLSEADERVKRRDGRDWHRDLGEAGFDRVEVFSTEWAQRMSAAAYRELCSTYSDHMLLPDGRRQALLDAIEDAIDASGGEVSVEYVTEVFSGRA